MYKNNLEQALNFGKISNYFLLFGADEYQIEIFAKEILDIYLKDDSNFLKLYFDEYDFSFAKSHLSEPSLFGSGNVLYIKSDKKIPSKDLKILIQACEKDNSNRFLFELHQSDMKVVLDSQKAFGQNFARFFKVNNPDEAIMLLFKAAKKLDLSITKNALYEIYFIHNENLYLAASELNKLASLNIHIEQDMIKSLVFGLSSISFEDFFDRFLDLKDIKNDFFGFLQDPTFNEIFFVNSFYRAFDRLFKIYSFVKINGKFDLKLALGYIPPSNIAQKLKKQSFLINQNGYLEIFKFLNELELDLKSLTKIEKSSYLLSKTISLQHYLSIISK